jgi:hypothetical protein
LSPVNTTYGAPGAAHRTSDSILPKLTSPREAQDTFSKSRYVKGANTTIGGENSIDDAVEKSKRYLKTYRQMKHEESMVNASQQELT